jgi:hypothetical protein
MEKKNNLENTFFGNFMYNDILAVEIFSFTGKH